MTPDGPDWFGRAGSSWGYALITSVMKRAGQRWF